MLNQKEVKPVKSSLHSKKLESFLVRNLIKSKLYFLILLTATTGGIVIGNILVPEQVPPAQANPLKFILTTAKLLDNVPVVEITKQGMVTLRCVGGPSYGDVVAGVVVNSTKNGKWLGEIRMRHGQAKYFWAKNGERYVAWTIDSKGRQVGDRVEGVFKYVE